MLLIDSWIRLPFREHNHDRAFSGINFESFGNHIASILQAKTQLLNECLMRIPLLHSPAANARFWPKVDLR